MRKTKQIIDMLKSPTHRKWVIAYLKTGKVHFLFGKFRQMMRKEQQAPIDIKNWIEENVIAATSHGIAGPGKQTMYAQKIDTTVTSVIDLIIPVYNGYEYLADLFESISKTRVPYRLIIINDCSTDERVEPFLQAIVNKSSQATSAQDAATIETETTTQTTTPLSAPILITNDTNLGFVKSVNKGFEIATSSKTISNNEIASNNEITTNITSANKTATTNNVVILNTDIVLPDNWLERLIHPILANSRVASVTPFTNSGKICSFPEYGKDNEMLPGVTLKQVDDAFQTIRPVYKQVPTGVGFCMAMSGKAIDEIGYFDAETFPRGYGEENDWCQRAVKAGYINASAENLFVWHKHKGSFTGSEKSDLIEQSQIKLAQLHKSYHSDVLKFTESRPHIEQRMYLLCKLLLISDLETKVYFSNCLAGGSERYLKKVIDEDEIGNIFVIRYDIYAKNYVFESSWIDGESESNECKRIAGRKFASFRFDDLADILCLLASASPAVAVKNRSEHIIHKGSVHNEPIIHEVVINSLVSYPDVTYALDIISKLSAMKMTYLLHDYLPICPVFYLLDKHGKYCGFSKFRDCTDCLAKNSATDKVYAYTTDIGAWRIAWKSFLKVCTEIIAFSEASKDILEQVYGTLQQVKGVPHVVDYIKPVSKGKKTSKTLNIAILGSLREHKGIEIVRDMARLIDKDKADTLIYLFGDTGFKISGKCIRKIGKYDISQLGKLTIAHDIDVFFIPSIWPETFSFTTQEAIELNMPVACFDLGAPAERVKVYEKGIVIPEISAKSAIETIEMVRSTFGSDNAKS